MRLWRISSRSAAMRNCTYSEVTGLRPLQGCVRFLTDGKATMMDAIMVALLFMLLFCLWAGMSAFGLICELFITGMSLDDEAGGVGALG